MKMGLRGRNRAFTLVEAMIVVVIVGVLALLATMAYRRWVHSAYLVEAQDMVANIRSAQESFRAENGGYLPVSTQLGPGYDYPATTPGRFKTAWGGPCSGCLSPNAWTSLNVQPNAPLAFGYSLIVNVGAQPPSSALKVDGKNLDLTAMVAPWYIVEADADMDGNGVFMNVYAVSTTNQVYVNNEGE